MAGLVQPKKYFYYFDALILCIRESLGASDICFYIYTPSHQIIRHLADRIERILDPQKLFKKALGGISHPSAAF